MPLTKKPQLAKLIARLAVTLYFTDPTGFSFPSTAFAQDVLPRGTSGAKLDDQGVDVTNGHFSVPLVAISIGDDGPGKLTYQRRWTPIVSTDAPQNFPFIDNSILFTVYAERKDPTSGAGAAGVSVNAGASSTFFLRTSLSPISFIAMPPDGSAYNINAAGIGTYTSKLGDVVTFSPERSGCISSFLNETYLNDASTSVKANGEKVNYVFYRIYDGTCSRNSNLRAKRIQSISSNLGYQIHFDYKKDTVDTTQDFWTLKAVKVINRFFDYCDDAVITCPQMSHSWQTLALTGNQITDGLGVVKSVTSNTVSIGQVITLKANAADVINSISHGASTWTYTEKYTGVSDIQINITRSDPDGKTVYTEANSDVGLLYKRIDELGRLTQYIYDANNQTQFSIPPGGKMSNGVPLSGYVKYEHDGRGNVKSITYVPNAGSTLPSLVEQFGFDAACNNLKTCNQPNWVKDASGNETDFNYDPNHGGLLSAMKPAPSIGAARPLLLKTYVQHYAWIKNASGTNVQLADPIWLIASETACQAAAGSNTAVCDNDAPKTITTYEYGSAATGETMLVKGKVVAVGGSTVRTCYTYDIYHRRVSATAPNANLGSCP